jgi:membrane protease YdiL (CAAX protease family)
MRCKLEAQNVIEFFLDAAQRSDRKAMILTGVLAVVIAPVVEETLFRGYLYGVLKRYLGGIGAGLLASVLFAAMHLNLAALPALFVLALCLTVAYEATGSLLVNIFMHSLFNLTSLLVIVLATNHPS